MINYINKRKSKIKKRRAIILLSFLFSLNFLNAQVFTKIPYSISGLDFKFNSATVQDIKWVDYDNDNDLDLILTLNQNSELRFYNNLGNDTFRIDNFNIGGIQNAKLSFGDYDNDGDLDFIYNGTNTCKLYKNTLPDSMYFIEYQDSSLTFLPMYNSFAQFNDLDNDGDFDIIHHGITITFIHHIYFSTLFQNLFNADSSFSNKNFTTLNQSYPYYLLSYDINNDGYMDLISQENKYYANKKSFNFNYQIKNTFVNNSFKTADYPLFRDNVKDLNNDGFLDLVQIGKTVDTNNIETLFFNIFNNLSNDNFILTDSTDYIGIPDLDSGLTNFLIFDSDNNGYQDLFYYNSNGSYLYKNSNDTFSKDSNFYTINSPNGISSYADYDNDGDLDLIQFGLGNISTLNEGSIFKNDSVKCNNSPMIPTGLYAEIKSDKIILNWDTASDIETPQAALSYNVMVGSTANGIDIVSPLSDTATGFRRVVKSGNAQLNNFFILDKSKLEMGDTIYWRVQTIDNGYGYSEFSAENSFIVCNDIKETQYDTICSNDSILWFSDYYSTGGIYMKFYGANTCDSTFTLNLKSFPSYNNIQNVDICSNESFFWHGNKYNTPGTYGIYETTNKGCDSIYILNLNIHHSTSVFENLDLCMGDSVKFGNKYLKTSGFYIDSSQTTYGCDSLTLLTLTVSPKDTVVYRSNDTLFVLNSAAYKRWYNFDNQAYVPNQYKTHFVPKTNGNYAVELTENGCVWMSRGFKFVGLGIENDFQNNEIEIIPNPASEFINIKSDIISQNSIIQIYSSDSKLVLKTKSDSEGSFSININNLTQGVYFIKIFNNVDVFTAKFVKE